MTGPHIGTVVSAIGYVIAIYGGWKLYQNAVPDRPEGMIPRTNDIGAFQRQQQENIEARQRGNRLGFGLLTFGAFLQLAGTLVAGFSN